LVEDFRLVQQLFHLAFADILGREAFEALSRPLRIASSSSHESLLFFGSLS
jgi:hypothetical protein